MEPIYWYVIAYIVGTGCGVFFGFKYGVGHGIVNTIELLIEGGFVKIRDKNADEVELVKLTFEERLNDTGNAETKDN